MTFFFQVATHHEDLISQATSVEQLEIHLDMMQNHMATLVSTSERLRAKVREPHKVRSMFITWSGSHVTFFGKKKVWT